MTTEEFRRIVVYVEQKAGVNLSEKRSLVTGRLDNYIASHHFSSYSQYMDAVERDTLGNMTQELINIITTNHTYFMREKEHFDFYRDVVLPECKKVKAAEKDLRVWCGASSTGEEPYTLAMITKDVFSLEGGWDTQILATDISTDVLRTAQKGIYLDEQIEPIPDVWRRRYFRKLPDGRYQVTDELKNEVLFRQFNLMSPLPFRKPLDVVFLRNVLIYFDKEHKDDLVGRIYENMRPGGYLFVGTTESIDRAKVPFKYVRPSVYRK